ncbi:MAG: DNA polymerase III subunit beta [Oscillospiraceae bacterium]|nr:DNA polymerase III subunit beta [Oscillospiraceae bacterium]
MKFTCEKTLLQGAVGTVLRAVSPKSSIPTLEGILLDAGEGLQLTGYNLQTGISTSLPAAVQESGHLVLSARLFSEIIRKFPDDMVSFSSDGFMVHLKCGMAEFNIMGIDPEEFPELPSVEQGEGFIIMQKSLKAMLAQTLFSVSSDETRPIHTGALFEVGEQKLTVVAIDGFRLALRREDLQRRAAFQDFSFVVPGAALGEVERICGDTEELVTVTCGERHVLFQIGDTFLISRRLEGEFLDYRSAIPGSHSVEIIAQNKELLTAIDRVSLMINEQNKSPLRCLFEEGELRLSTRTAIGDANDRCPVQGDGKGLEIGFNNTYLMDALRYAPAQQVRLEMTTGVSPCVILPLEGEPDNFLYMVLPVRLKAGV